MFFQKEMINSIFGTNPILFLLLQSLLTGLPLLPSMSQIILLKWGRELGASLQTFQVFHVFFIFSSDFLKLDIEMPPGRSAKFIISVSQRLPMVSSIESIDLLLPRSSRSNVELQCDSSNSWGIFTRTEYNSTFWDSKTSQSLFPALSCVSE